jgi:hypothetical protein
MTTRPPGPTPRASAALAPRRISETRLTESIMTATPSPAPAKDGTTGDFNDSATT